MKIMRVLAGITLSLLLDACGEYSSAVGLAKPSTAPPAGAMTGYDDAGTASWVEQSFADEPDPVLEVAEQQRADDQIDSVSVTATDLENANASTDFVAPAAEPPTTDIWQRISRGMTLPPSLDNPLVKKHLRAYQGNQRYFDRIMPQMALYLPHILGELEQRGAPLELALVPLIESGYNPAARAPRGIAGLWQFTRGTGDMLGIPRNSWYDGRLDAVVSTRVAADYLTDLNEDFGGDWLLAIAAYNCGARSVSDALAKNQRQGKSGDFWSLKLKGRARDYVPELLALAEVIRNPRRYGIHLSALADVPPVETVTVDQPFSLNQAAKLADVEAGTLRRLNPAYLRGVVPPSGVYQLVVPAGTRDLFEIALMTTAPDALAVATQTAIPAPPTSGEHIEYRVKHGDTLSAIARRHKVTVADVKAKNQLLADFLPIGKVLKIPDPGRPMRRAREASIGFKRP